jgi:uncharacterized membrane protein
VSNLAQWSAIVAFFVPVVVALINQPKWPAQVKAGLFFVVSLVAAGGTAYFQGDLTGKRFLDSALIIVAAAAAYYHGLWKPTQVAPTIEAKSSPK